MKTYYEKWKELPTKRNLTGAAALVAVKQNGYAIRYVKDQMEAVCLAAVKQEGNALQYVKDQTEEICLAAVKQNSSALAWVDEDIVKNL